MSDKSTVHRIDLAESYPQLQALHEMTKIPIPQLAELAVKDGLGPLEQRLRQAFGDVPSAPPPPPASNGVPARAAAR